MVNKLLFFCFRLIVHEEPNSSIVAIIEGYLIRAHFMAVDNLDVHTPASEHHFECCVRTIDDSNYYGRIAFDCPGVQ